MQKPVGFGMGQWFCRRYTKIHALVAAPPVRRLTILACVATWDREVMLERQREGISEAKADDKYSTD